MGDFTYVDIFATKGIEYILVIGGLLLFVPFWKFLHRPAPQTASVRETAVPVVGEWFQTPDEVFYHPGHAWAAPAKSEEEVVLVGMDDFSQKLVGQIRELEVPAVGSTVTQGDRGWSLVVDSKSVPMLSPVDGTVTEVNEEVLKDPGRIHRDPYGSSWLMKVRVPGRSANLNNLLSGRFAKRWMDQVREDLQARMADQNLGVVYQDGGVPVQGMARVIDPERWDAVAAEFLRVS